MFSIEEEKLIAGAAINYNDICWIYPLHVKNIFGMGNNRYSTLLGILCLDIQEVQKEMTKLNIAPEKMPKSAFEYLMGQASVDRTFLVELSEAFSTFIREKVHFLFEAKEILIGDGFKERRVLNEENFEDFQNIVRAQNCLPVPEPIPLNESPMARKFRLRREQVKEAKRKQAAKSGEETSWTDSITTLICLNVGVNYSNVGDLTIYQFRNLFTRAQMKYKYDLDIRMIAAGADPKKIKPKHWFGKLD